MIQGRLQTLLAVDWFIRCHVHTFADCFLHPLLFSGRSAPGDDTSRKYASLIGSTSSKTSLSFSLTASQSSKLTPLSASINTRKYQLGPSFYILLPRVPNEVRGQSALRVVLRYEKHFYSIANSSFTSLKTYPLLEQAYTTGDAFNAEPAMRTKEWGPHSFLHHRMLTITINDCTT